MSDTADRESGTTSIAPLSPLLDAGRREIIFVDANVANAASLAAEAAAQRPGAEVVMLDGGGNGLAEMAGFLASSGLTGLDAIHVLSDGSSGSLDLGSLTLSSANLTAETSDLGTIGAALAPGGDLLLYACDLAVGSGGTALVSGIAQAAGANVEASDHVVGAASLGGSWALDVAQGTPTTAALDLSAYGATLLPTPAAPALQAGFSSTNANTTNIATPVFTGTVVAGATVSLYDGASLIGTAVTDTAGGYVIDPSTTLASGSHTLTLVEVSGGTTLTSPGFTLSVAGTSNVVITAEPVSGTYGVTYDESGSPVLVDSILTVTENNAYTYTTNAVYNGGTLAFTTSATGSDQLTLNPVSSASSAAGALSATADGKAWLGNGSAAVQVGTFTGSGTGNLVIGFTSSLVTDAVVQGFARMVSYSNSASNTPSSPATIAITVTDAHGTGTTTHTTVGFTNSNGANTGLALTLSGPANAAVTNGAAVYVDTGLTVTGAVAIPQAQVIIENDKPGDVLSWSTAAAAADGLTGSFNASTGVLTVTTNSGGTGSEAQYQDFLRHVAFNTTSSNTTARSINFVLGGALYYSLNGHLYNFVSSPGISYQAAEVAASKSTLYGLQGYLATVTSAGENSFIAARLSGQGWMGASDQYTAPLVTNISGYDRAYGHWHWITGPEADNVGTDGLPGQFLLQETGGYNYTFNGVTTSYPSSTGGGVAINSSYVNWSNGEPNDDDTGGEHFAHFYTTGLWNDYSASNPSIQGYVVEYGGMPGDATLNIAKTETLAVELTAPAAPTGIGLLAASDSGAHGDGITSVTTPSIVGTGASGDTLKLYDGSVLLGTTTVLGDGSWTITPGTALSEGAHTLTAAQIDGNSNISALSSVFPLTIDTTAPAVPGAPTLALASDSGVHGDRLTNVVTPTIDGTGAIGDSVALYDSGTLVGTGTIGAGGAWAVPTSMLASGGHTLTVIETDPAGNVSGASSALTITVDTTPPAIPAAPTLDVGSDSGVLGDDITNVVTPTIDGIGTAGDTVTIYNGSLAAGTATVGVSGTWAIATNTLTMGGHLLTVKEADPAGNLSAASPPLMLAIQTTPPSAPAALTLDMGSDSGVLGDRITNVATPTIDGTGIIGETITLYDGGSLAGTGTVGAGGLWSVQTGSLASGAHTFTAKQADPAANLSSASPSLVVTIDTTVPAVPAAPVLAGASDSGVRGDNVTNIVTPTIDGAGTIGDTVTLYDGVIAVGSGTIGSAGTWAVPTASLASGIHTLTVKEASPAGNLSIASPALVLTIDTTPPAAPAAPTLDLASDSGVRGDDLTDIINPLIDGVGTAGDTVRIYDSGTLVGSGTIRAGGAWSVSTSVYVSGAHTLTVTETDPAGNASGASPPLVLTIDTTAPGLPGAPTLDAASDSGVPRDRITNVATPSIDGLGTVGDAVTLYDGGTIVGSGTIGAGGTWSLPTGMLSAGAHSLTVKETDPAGNASSASLPLVLTIDATAPALPGAPTLDAASDSGAPGDDITNVVTPTIDGVGTVGDTVTLYDGGSAVGTATIGAGGAWSVPTSALGSGAHTLTVTETDPAGNASGASPPLVLTIDTTAPTLPGAPTLDAASDSGVPGDRITNVATPSIDGLGTVGDTVTLYDGGTIVGSGTIGAGGTWSLPTGMLSAGAHSLTVKETDPAGNASSASLPLVLTIDATAPALPGAPTLDAASDSGAPGDDITNVVTPTIDGVGTAGDTVTLYDGGSAVGTATIGAGGAWSVPTSALASGAHTLTVTETDPAGNASGASPPLVLTIDTTAPALPGAPTLDAASDSGVPGDDITSVATPSIDGLGTAGDTIALFDGASIIGTATIGAGGAWSVPTSALASGFHTLTAIEADPAGNASSASPPLVLTIDTSTPAPPGAPGLVPADDSGVQGDGITSNSEPAITGTGTDGDVVTLFDGTSILGTVSVSNGDWTITLSTILATGGHALTATQTDPAGTTSPSSQPFLLTIDTATPATPLDLVLTDATNTGSKTDAITSDASPTVAGLGTSGDLLTLYDGTVLLGTTAIIAADGSWSITISQILGDGLHPITATETDTAGNVSAPSSTLPLVIDTSTPAAPPAPTLDPSTDSGIAGDDITNVTTPLIDGTGTVGDTVAVYGSMVLIGVATVDATGGWSTNVGTLANGAQAITATETNEAGTVSPQSAPLALTIDTTAPVVSAISNTTAGTDVDANKLISISLTPSKTMIADITGGTPALGLSNGGVATYAGIGSDGTLLFTYTVPASGADTADLTITGLALNGGSLTDIAGNALDVSGVAGLAGSDTHLMIDTVAPTPTTLGTVGSSGLSGTAEPGSTIQFYDGTTPLGTATAGLNGAWTYSVAGLAAGGHSLTATVADAAGNVSRPSVPLSITMGSNGAFAVMTTDNTGNTTTANYDPNNGLTSKVVTAPADQSGNVVAKTYDPGGTLQQATTSNSQGLVTTTVTPTATLRNIYDAAGTLIGTVTAPPGDATTDTSFSTTPDDLGASTQTGPSASVVTLIAETQVLTASGNDTISTGTGADTINAGSHAVSVAGGAGKLTFYGGTQASTVAGGSGVATMLGGSGGGVFTGGSTGGNVLIASGGNTTLVGGGTGDTLFGSAHGTDLLQALHGHSTLVGGGGISTLTGDGAGNLIFAGAGVSTVFGESAGNTVIAGSGHTVIVSQSADLVFGGAGSAIEFGSSVSGGLLTAGSGSTTIVGGAGASEIVGGSGTSTVFAGTGDDTIWAGTGHMTATLGNGDDLVVLGSGETNLFTGSGADDLVVVAGTGAAKGQTLIYGFKVGTDKVSLYGYDQSALQQSVSGGNMVLTLSDHTTITLAGVTQLAAGSIIG